MKAHWTVVDEVYESDSCQKWNEDMFDGVCKAVDVAQVQLWSFVQVEHYLFSLLHYDPAKTSSLTRHGLVVFPEASYPDEQDYHTPNAA